MFNPKPEERVNALVQLLQETDPDNTTEKGVAGVEAGFVRRARKGQLVFDEEYGSEIARRFSQLDETDQEAFWENVKLESERDNWWAGGPGSEKWAGNRKGSRRPVALRPPICSPGCLSLEEALNCLGRVRARGQEWTARCPAHDTHHNSLVISESKYKPGEPVFYCYAGCSHSAVKDALLAMRSDG